MLELVSVFVPRLELFKASECDETRDEGSGLSRARKIEVRRRNQDYESIGRVVRKKVQFTYLVRLTESENISLDLR